MKLVFFSVMYRVLTDYRIQNSRLFPKQYFFFRLKVIKQVINRDLKNTGTKLFSWVQVRLNKIQPKQKIFTHKALVVAYKKNSFFPFSRLYLYFQTFSRSGKFAGQISRLFQKLKTLYEPCMPAEPFFCLVDFGVPKILHESSKISRLTSLEVCPVAVFFFSLWCMDIVGKVDVGHYET